MLFGNGDSFDISWYDNGASSYTFDGKWDSATTITNADLKWDTSDTWTFKEVKWVNDLDWSQPVEAQWPGLYWPDG